ncbi:MAG TPA: zf-HC2 domain-containing protein [Blastocatellia bacterium]|nr:zf-HC2 domain-containing protein [Blastocatellia bacterium]
MNCEKFERLIALEVEGDLPDKERSRLTDHLAMCGSCRRFSEELRDSQNALHGYTGGDFDENLLAGIRRNVMAQIEEGRVSRGYLDQIARWLGISDFRRFAWAMTGVAAILAVATTFVVLTVVRSEKSIYISVNVPQIKLPGAGSIVIPKVDPFRNRDRKPRISNRPPKVSSPSFVAVADSTPPSLVNSDTEIKGAGTEITDTTASNDRSIGPKKETTRFEIPTSNPNIKIIWIVDKKPNAPPAAVLSSSE